MLKTQNLTMEPPFIVFGMFGGHAQFRVEQIIDGLFLQTKIVKQIP